MSIYNTLSYQEILRSRVSEVKSAHPGKGLVRICEKAGLHGSFISAVLKGHRHLNSDQLFAFCEELSFTEQEIDYLLLLLSFDKATHPKLKTKYKKEISQIQKEKNTATSYIQAKPQGEMDLTIAEYYSDPYFSIIYIYLGVDKYKQEPLLLCDKLHLSPEQIQNYLQRLDEMGLIRRGTPVELIKRHFHLPKDFFICDAHQLSIKHLSQTKLLQLNSNKKETLCVTFSGEEETFRNVREEFLKFLKTIEVYVREGKSEEVFQLNFDLHYWS